MDDKILLNGLILVKRYFYDNVTENNYLELIDFAANDINKHYQNYGCGIDIIYILDKNGNEIKQDLTFENIIPLNLYEILKSNETGEFKRITSISIPIYSKLEDLICHPKSLIFRKFHKIACS